MALDSSKTQLLRISGLGRTWFNHLLFNERQNEQDFLVSKSLWVRSPCPTVNQTVFQTFNVKGPQTAL